MIKITIEQVTITKYPAKENILKKRTPTTIKGDADYNNRQETKNIDEYEIVDVTKESTCKTTLLNQEITDDSKFDLARVITAINNLGNQDMLRK